MQKRSTSTVSAGRKSTETKAEKATPMATAKAAIPPSRDEIARRAYEIYVARGQVSGREMEDWLQAERELTLTVSLNN